MQSYSSNSWLEWRLERKFIQAIAEKGQETEKILWGSLISFDLENRRKTETQRCKQCEYLKCLTLFPPFTSQTGETSLFPGETLHLGRVVWLRLPTKRASSPLRLLLLICSSKLIQQLPNDLNTHRWSIVQRKHGQLPRIFLGRLDYFVLKFSVSQEQLSKVQFNNKNWSRIWENGFYLSHILFISHHLIIWNVNAGLNTLKTHKMMSRVARSITLERRRPFNIVGKF